MRVYGTFFRGKGSKHTIAVAQNLFQTISVPFRARLDYNYRITTIYSLLTFGDS